MNTTTQSQPASIATHTPTPWRITKHSPPWVAGKPFELSEPLGIVLGFSNWRCRGFFATMKEAKQARAALAAAQS